MQGDLTTRAAADLEHLCVTIPTRVVGTDGNRAAVAYLADRFAALGWQVETPAFQCMDWSESGVELRAGTTEFEARASSYTLGALIANTPLVVANDIDELERAELRGKIALLRGELGKEQLAPKNHPWWKPEAHQRIIAALERGEPAAIITAATRNPDAAGAPYPFALIEDGDIDIPSCYITEEDGQKLAVYAGREVDLEIRATRRPAEGANVIARRADSAESGAANAQNGRWVITAHIDTARGTPGALDNATGVITLLLLGELLADSDAARRVELVAFNGEDNYAAPGEQLYVQENGDLSDIALAINIDGAGYRRSDTLFSLYGCDDALARRLRAKFASSGLVEGPQWYAGDHTIFAMAGRPAVAITSDLTDVSEQIIHTSADAPEIVDPAKLAQIATALAGLLG